MPHLCNVSEKPRSTGAASTLPRMRHPACCRRGLSGCHIGGITLETQSITPVQAARHHPPKHKPGPGGHGRPHGTGPGGAEARSGPRTARDAQGPEAQTPQGPKIQTRGARKAEAGPTPARPGGGGDRTRRQKESISSPFPTDSRRACHRYSSPRGIRRTFARRPLRTCHPRRTTSFRNG